MQGLGRHALDRDRASASEKKTSLRRQGRSAASPGAKTARRVATGKGRRRSPWRVGFIAKRMMHALLGSAAGEAYRGFVAFLDVCCLWPYTAMYSAFKVSGFAHGNIRFN